MDLKNKKKQKKKQTNKNAKSFVTQQITSSVANIDIQVSNPPSSNYRIIKSRREGKNMNKHSIIELTSSKHWVISSPIQSTNR